ncbi:MAG: ABC transporter ATP-binding protein, partial [Acidimicrobiales bacterium]
MPALDVGGLVVRYGDRVAVDGLDLQADAGQGLGLFGPPSPRKTHTMEALQGYRKPATGRVRVLGL